MTYDNPDEFVEELFDFFLSRYHIGLETQMRGSDFIFDCINLFHYKCHEINFKCGASYIDSADSIKKKKTINPRNNDDECFQYAVTIALNFDEIKKYPK